MLSYIDPIIFPDRCDVLEIVSSQRYVYPIFKNGSSSLSESGYRVLNHSELSALTNVEVYIRDPFERFASGVQTYLDNLDPALDQTTALHFITEYLFLNRHFCPQFHWLLNLQRYTNASITILPLHQLSDITSITANTSSKNNELIEVLKQNNKIQFYLQIDKVLTEDLLGQTVLFKDIVGIIQTKYPELYTEVIARSLEIVKHVMP